MRQLPRRGRLSALILVATLLGASACGSAGDDSGSDGDAGQPRSGGTLTYLLSGEIPSLDPVTFAVPSNPSFLAPRALAVFDALAIENPATGAMDMRLAESVESGDGKVWTLKLRPGLTFSDGTPLDAEAVKFNWQRIGDPANHSPMAPYAQQIESMDAGDARTLTVHLKAVNAAFPRVVARYLTYIGSPSAIRTEGAGFGSKPVGAGAYTVKEFVRDSQLVLDRNPKYQGTTYLDRIVIKPVVDESQRLNTLSTEGADAIFSSDPNTAAQAKDAGFTPVETTLNGGSDIMFNVRKAPFDDIRARRAIALALDPQALNSGLYNGLSKTVDTLFTSSSPFYDASVHQAAPDHDRAQALFDELAAAQKPLNVTFLVPQSFATRAEWFQTQLAKYRNVTVKLQSVPDSQAPATAGSGDFQAAFLTSSWLYPDPSMATFFGTGGTQNWGGYSNPQVDAALATARGTQDQNTQKSAWSTVQQAIVADVPSVFYGRPTYQVIRSRKVHGLTPVGDGTPLWTSVWLSQ